MHLTASMRVIMRWLFAVALCLVSSSTQAVGLSLHAVHLSPSLSLLTWTVPSPSSVLSLSSSPLVSSRRVSLSASSASHLVIRVSDSASASAHFTLCDRHDSDQRQQRDPTSAAAPHCAHATLPAALPSSLSTLRPDGRQRWDLSGARLAAEVTRSPDETTAHRFTWSVATVTADPAAPPLTYSLFAEWTAHTITEDQLKTTGGKGLAADTTDADLSPSLQTHSMRICSAQSHGSQGAQQLHCDVPADRLPRGVELTLHLLTECDYQTIDAEAAGEAMPHCLSAISPAVVVTLEPLLTEVPLPVAAPLLSLTAVLGVSHVDNDAAVSEALCTFYEQTSGSGWSTNTGWCNTSVPICGSGTEPGWFGVGCDATFTVVISLDLGSNGLASTSAVDISPLFAVLTQLTLLDLSANEDLLLSQLDLTPLHSLITLSLSRGWIPTSPIFRPLLLPLPCRLSIIDLGYTTFAVSDWSACTQFTSIDISSVQAPFPFAAITRMPLLQVFTASGSGLVSGSNNTSLSGGELTLSILAHLNITSPQLQNLDISYSRLQFGSPGALDTFPHIVAPLLTTLILDGLPLRSGPLGPADPMWLADMPSLVELSLLDLRSATIDTAAFLHASRALQIWRCDSPVLGDLSPLLPMASLTQLLLDATELRSQLPHNLSAVWTNLTSIHCSGCKLRGNLPSFQNLRFLTHIGLDRNALSGRIGVDFASGCPVLIAIVLSNNQLRGPLPSFCETPLINLAAFDSNLIDSFPPLDCYGGIIQLQLQSNLQMRGQLPPNLWQQLHSITTLVLSQTSLNGSLPDGVASMTTMLSFFASGCRFSGSLPRNIDALAIDLSHNTFEGPLIMYDDNFGGTPQINSLRLASAGRLTCPIQLDAIKALVSMDISGNGFDLCDWTNVTLPPYVTQIDISQNDWLPFDLTIQPQLVSLIANRANVRGVMRRDPQLSLQSLSLDLNPFTPINSEGVSVGSQLQYLLSGDGSAINLLSFSCVACGLSVPLTDIVQLIAGTRLQILRLQENQLFSDFAGTPGYQLFADTFAEIVSFSIANNSDVRGQLPQTNYVSPGTSLDFSSTGLSGPLPLSWVNLPALTQLNIQNTNVKCDLSVDSGGRLQCNDQSVLAASPTTAIESSSLADPAAGVHCSALTIVATGSSGVTADPSYHSHTECRCDVNSFGLNALCYRCPEGCTCEQDRIANCFPVVQRGSIGVNAALGASTARSVVAGSIAPFTVTALLPCPRTVTGSSLCNPDGITWPSFYRISEQAGSDSVSAAVTGSGTSSSSDSDLDLSGWCYPGHTGRLCAACSNGYFSSGRWCLKCLSEGVHVLILIANLLLIVVLIAYLYLKSPGAQTSAHALRRYCARLGRWDQSQREASLVSPVSALASNRASPLPPSDSASDAGSSAPSASDSANPLKLLIFHCQQLSLLIHTSASLPPVFAGFLSLTNSGSSGFSLASLVAMECISSGWTLAARCWLTVIVPLIIAAVASITAMCDRRPGESRSIQLQTRKQPLLSEQDSAVDSSEQSQALASSTVPRIYSVCVSLLYFLVFPCAQTVLSAVTCTDTRQSDQSFLNLFPDQACDDEWRRSVLPPAVLGLLFWVVAFPVGSTLMLFQLRSRLAASSGADSSSALSVWPICADLLLPYTAGRWYWEQLFLIRRLLLVAAVTIIPSSSLYLPLVLFSIIQLSALQQHWAHPYAHSLLNAGELASLYLLLINYISAIILQSGLVEGGFQQTANGWAAALFVVNLAFLMILVAGLFGWARDWIATRLFARKHQQHQQRL